MQLALHVERGYMSRLFSRMTFCRLHRTRVGVCLMFAWGSNGVNWAEPCETYPNLTRLRFKSYGSNSGFRVFGDLDIDL